MTTHNTIADTADNLCMMNKTSVTDVGDYENQHTLTTIYNDEGMSHEMEETMSEEAEEIDVPLTDRDTVMGNIANKSVTHKKEEPKLKVVCVDLLGSDLWTETHSESSVMLRRSALKKWQTTISLQQL